MDHEQSGRMVVLVEDDPAHAMLVERCLPRDRHDAQFKHFRRPHDALRWIGHPDSPAVDLMLIDWNLGRYTGEETLVLLRSGIRGVQVPAVVLTTSPNRQDYLRAIDAGANSYVVKPIGFEGFREAVSAVMAYWLEMNLTRRGRCPRER